MINTAEARIVASFTFISCLVLGAWTSVERVLVESSLLPTDTATVRVIMLFVPLVATGVAVQGTRVTEVAWARTLGGAAVMLGGLSILGAINYALIGV